MDPVRVYSNAMLDRITDAVLALNADGVITYINPAGTALFGLSAGDDCWSSLPENSDAVFKQTCQKAFRTGRSCSCTEILGSQEQQFDIRVYPDKEGVTVLLRPIHQPERSPFTAVQTEAEKKVQAEKELSDKIINSLPGIFYMADATPRLLRWNKAFETISGYTAGELGSMVPIELFDTRDHPSFKTAMAQALTEGTGRTEARLVSKDGAVTPFYFTGVRIEYNGQVAMLGTGIDMTEQKKAAEEIRKSAERYFLTTMATNDMIWDWNLLTNEIWWNTNYNKLFGYDENINLHQIWSWKESIHPEDKERVVDGIYKVIKSGGIFWTDEYRYLKKDGTVLSVYDRGYVIHDESGKPCRMIGSMLDITERINTEKALREKEERYRNLFERASDSIVVHDLQGNIIDTNFAAQGFSGYLQDQLQRMKITDLLFPEDLKTVPIPFDKLKAGETTYSRRRVKTHSGVVRIMEVSSRMQPDGNIMAILRDITERTETEKALRNSELRFRALTGNAPVGIFETDAEGATTYVNEKMIEYTGLSFDELLRTSWIQCIHPDDRASLISTWNHHLEEKTESSQQYRIVTKNGSIRWVQGKAIPVYDKNGQFDGYLGTVSDITNEKLALIALSESEEKYRTLVEQASDAIYIVDGGGKVVTVNPSASRLSGYTEQELLQMNIYDFVFEEDLQSNPFRFDELLAGKTVIVERSFKVKDNKVLDVECLANMLSDGRVLVFARDITERIKTQNEILKEKNFSDSIINSLPGIFYLYDEHGKFLRWNKNFEYVSGYSAAEIKTMHPADFFDEQEKELMKKKVYEVLSTGMGDVEAHFFTRDKEKIPYYFNGWRVIFENKLCLIGVGIDITEKRKAETLLLQSYDDIRRLASHLNHVREEERKRIGREIHDELGQQLTAIKMDMAWIEKKLSAEDELIKNKIKNVITLLDGGNRSVRRILTELSLGINDNNGLLEALERQNRQFEASTGIQVQFATTEKTVQVSEAIANCIFRVYQESLTNIMRYADATAVETLLQADDEMITVSIHDNGKGFDITTIPSKTSFGILGMRERVQAQKGKFEIKSIKGKGTTVIIKVPCRQ